MIAIKSPSPDTDKLGNIVFIIECDSSAITNAILPSSGFPKVVHVGIAEGSWPFKKAFYLFFWQRSFHAKDVQTSSSDPTTWTEMVERTRKNTIFSIHFNQLKNLYNFLVNWIVRLRWFLSRERWGRGLKCRGIRVFNNTIKQKIKNHPEGEKTSRQAEDWCTVKHDTLYERQRISTGLQTPGG